MISFEVEGTPVQQGSKRIGRAGKGGRPIIIDDNDVALAAWRSLVTVRARAAAAREGVRDYDGPVSVDLEFRFSRPKHHYRTGRFAGELKDSAPVAHTVKPDLDKLIRAVLDSLTTAHVYRDDSQVVFLRPSKVYAGPVPGGKYPPLGPAGVSVAVRPVTFEGVPL